MEDTANHKEIPNSTDEKCAKVEDFDFQILWCLNIGIGGFPKNLLSR
jgi:hypothetical protein